jgi:hypothetical protein
LVEKEISEQIKRETDEDLREERELFRANEFINGTTARYPCGVLRGDYEKAVCPFSRPLCPVRGAGLQPRKGLEGCEAPWPER